MLKSPKSALPLSAEGEPMIGIVTGPTHPRGLDHLVVGVRDLDAAAAFYQRLGFHVGQRNVHPWKTENRIVQFPGSFLELITVPDGARIPQHEPSHFSFGAYVQAALHRGEGPCMLSLESADAKADAASFSASGLGNFEPFFFERKGVKPNGEPMHVAFTLAFAHDAMAQECGFFVCQHHEPQNFWNSAFQQHANGASALSSVMMIAENPTDHHIFLQAFTGLRGPRSSSLGLSFSLPRGRLDVVTPRAAAAMLGDEAWLKTTKPRFAAFSVAVPDMVKMEKQLQAAGSPAMKIGRCLIVPAHAAFGTAIVFEPES